MAKSDDKESIRATINAFADAIRGKHAQGARACFTKDSVGFYLAPPLRAFPHEDDLEGWFATGPDRLGMRCATWKSHPERTSPTVIA